MESALKLQTMIACPLRFSLRLLSQGCLISALLCASNPRRLSSAQQKQFRKCFINKRPSPRFSLSTLKLVSSQAILKTF